jgi:Zn-dependent M32 family carboxypeptidase
MLRYELERKMLSTATLAGAELPEAWHAGWPSAWGCVPSGATSEGCLQDIHWAVGHPSAISRPMPSAP